MLIGYSSQETETTKCPTVDEWVIKMWYIYIVKHYSAGKKTETVKSVGELIGTRV